MEKLKYILFIFFSALSLLFLIFLTNKKNDDIDNLFLYKFSFNFNESFGYYDKKIFDKLNKNFEYISKTKVDNNIIEFYSSVFLIDPEKMINNIGMTFLVESDVEVIILNKLMLLESMDQSLFDDEIINKATNIEYLSSVVEYFANIYSIDPKIALTIPLIESGYNNSRMLSNNNIFGGMSKGNLIKYKTVEYGILQYIQILDNYKKSGIKTIEEISYYYNPHIIDGERFYNLNWVTKIKNNLNKIPIKNIKSLSDFIC